MAGEKAKAKEYAQVLYVKENLHQKVIADRVGVTEKTLSKWINEGNWKSLKRSLLTTKQTQITLLYDQLEWQNNEIANRQNKVATTKEADVISKLSASIQKLEVETSLGETVDVGRKFIGFVQGDDLELAKKITAWFDLYIQTLIK